MSRKLILLSAVVGAAAWPLGDRVAGEEPTDLAVIKRARNELCWRTRRAGACTRAKGKIILRACRHAPYRSSSQEHARED
jgi:hypothetical protein